MGKECRRQIEEGYGLDVQASGYLKLYKGLLPENKTSGEGRAAAMGEKGSSEIVPGTSVADTSMVTLEFGLGPHFHAIYDKVLFRGLKEFAPHAKGEWEISDADRAARLQKLNQLTKMLETCEAMLETCEADREARLDQIKELTRIVKNLKAERDETGNKINKLEKSLTLESKRAQAAEKGWRNLEAEFSVRQARKLGLVKVKRFDSSIASKSNSRKQKKSPES